MISLKQLRYAIAVEKTLHFKKAAESSHVSQSALSTAINELENQLGLQIFERNNKKVLITPIGLQVLEKAKNILFDVDGLLSLAESQQAPLNFPITVGAIPTICPYLLPRMLPIMNEQFPQAQLNIVEEQSHVLVDMVRQGDIDTAILALPYPIDGLLSLEFWQEDFYWVVAKGEPHSTQTEVSSETLDHSNLMLLKDGHCLKEHALEACKLSKQTANEGFGASSLNTLIQMVANKLGTTLIPAMARDQLLPEQRNLVAVHLNEPGPHRHIAFIFRPNYTRMSSIEALAELCKKALG